MPSESSSTDSPFCDHGTCGWKPRYDAEGNRLTEEPPLDGATCRCGHIGRYHFWDGKKRRSCLQFRCECGDFAPQAPEEPPLTPEEEEEAECPHESWEVTSQWRDDLTNKWWKSRRCADCGEVLDTIPEDEAHEFGDESAPVSDEPPPPQPERRPPYAVAYSVNGHLYEVAVPGDATAQAVDGALIITHSLGQVAGIVRIMPMQKEAS